jgi:hypothetical protein
MGQACQYQVAGITPDPGIPFCGPGGYTMTPAQIAAVQLAQEQGGYSDTSEAGGNFAGAFSSPAAAAASGATYGGSSKAVVLPAPKPSAAPAQSNAPTAKPVVTPVTSTAVQSNAPAPTTVTPTPSGPVLSSGGQFISPAVALGSGCFSLFPGESCIGPIGSTTLLVGAGLLGVLFLLGGHK